MDGKTTCIEKNFGFKNWLNGKTIYTKKLLGFRKLLNGKTTYSRKLLGLKNYLFQKIACVEIFFCMGNLIILKIFLH